MRIAGSAWIRLAAGFVMLTSVSALTPAPRAWASGAYFTTYDHHVEKGELEIVLLNALARPSRFERLVGEGSILAHMIELEYGFTHQLAGEIQGEWAEDLQSGEARFTGIRLEGRYRLWARDTALNPTLYLEYEDLDSEVHFKKTVSGWVHAPYEQHEEEERERVLESKLILSHDFERVNVAFNSIHETELESGVTELGYAFGILYDLGGGERPDDESACRCAGEMRACRCAHCRGEVDGCPCAGRGAVAFGLELFGGLGDTRSFRIQPARQEHYIGPLVAYHVTSRIMIHGQVALGLSRASQNLVRLNLGYEF